ncbi:hypothetical protein [Hoylesella timonensis]|nr:hypothetical protein [Hoylesella timonensis]
MRLNSRVVSYRQGNNDSEPIGGGNYQRMLAASYSHKSCYFLLKD